MLLLLEELLLAALSLLLDSREWRSAVGRAGRGSWPPKV
jgi:hypothetical protein